VSSLLPARRKPNLDAQLILRGGVKRQEVNLMSELVVKSLGIKILHNFLRTQRRTDRSEDTENWGGAADGKCAHPVLRCGLYASRNAGLMQ